MQMNCAGVEEMVAGENQKPFIILWDNDGTISGSNNPNDAQAKSKVILPGVKNAMEHADYNFIISGCKTVESEQQDFDPDKVVAKFTELMSKLPINAAVFSPHVGGVSCYVIIKKANNTIVVKKAHEDSRYEQYIGKFKKPEIGMLVVMRDIIKEEFNMEVKAENTVMIGDTWHDEAAAKTFGISFIDANKIHQGNVNLRQIINLKKQ